MNIDNTTMETILIFDIVVKNNANYPSSLPQTRNNFTVNVN